MTRAKAKAKPATPKEYLSQREIDGLNDEKKELETALYESNEYGAGTQGAQVDKAKLKSEINRIGAAIHHGTPNQVRAVEKDKLAKEEKELEDTISTGMPSWYEMHQPTKNPGAVRKHMAWSKRNKVNIDRYKQIQRILRPLEPKSIEVLRKEK